MKKTATISVDEDIWDMAKEELPNLSEFIENCLKSYLSTDNNVASIQDELNKIKEAQLKIYLLSEVKDNKYSDVRANTVWTKIWRQYRSYQTFNDDEIESASKVLGYSNDYLIELLNDLYLEVPPREYNSCDDFNTALKKHGD